MLYMLPYLYYNHQCIAGNLILEDMYHLEIEEATSSQSTCTRLRIHNLKQTGSNSTVVTVDKTGKCSTDNTPSSMFV
eukprot:TRINITY_DN14066_c0_g1_i1.p1 TRINITY_DN14066_c0_g1~~TRINITY_DN14066_c0_g1_i1.p1  ORF type:complete len:77 (-),score=8.63 TRINITY_DN14066_c0_g1_i1:29-259(-)